MADESTCSAWLSVQGGGGLFLGMLSVVADFPRPYRSYAQPWRICGEQDLACRWGGQAWILEPRGAAQAAGQAGPWQALAPAPAESKQMETKTSQPATEVDRGAPKGRCRD